MADAEEDLYDEFGNYIGPDLDESSDDDSDEDGDSQQERTRSSSRHDIPEDASDVSNDEDEGEGGGAIVPMDEENVQDETTAAPQNAIVLHEDKVNYPSAEQVYGEEVRTAVLDEDAMDLEVPIVAPVETKSFIATNTHLVEDLDDDKDDDNIVSSDFMSLLFHNRDTTKTRRGVALVGDYHSGKTTLVDMLLEQTKGTMDAFGPRASLDSSHKGGPRYTDTLPWEQERQLSIKSTPIALPLSDLRGKTHLLTLVDCPGNVQFYDESVAALKAVDGAIVCVDAVEGVNGQIHTEMLLKTIVSEGLNMVLVINKVDRLWVELQLPPNDAYYKILHTIESVNELIAQYSRGRYPLLSPERNNVAFASSIHGYCFTLQSFAQLYLDHATINRINNKDGGDENYNNNNNNDASNVWNSNSGLGNNLTLEEFAKRLWGSSYVDPDTNTFVKTPPPGGAQRTFCRFVLDPLYKIYSACLGEHEADVAKLLRSVGVLLTKDILRGSVRPLLRAALKRFFENTSTGGFVGMVLQHIPCPADAAMGKVARCYTGPLDSPIAKAMAQCDSSGPFMMHCVKLYSSRDGQSFSAFGRIYSGSIKPGDKVKVLGEAFSPDDDEDMASATVTTVSIPRGRRRTEVTMAPAGNWVLLDGVDANIAKTATICSANNVDDDIMDEMHIFAPLKFPEAGGEAVMKLAVEPVKPAELPKMVEGLRRISKSYPMARTRVEESGEHVLFGTGELYLDCVMHDLRHVYSDIEVKVADPVVGFRETVLEMSSVKCFAETANKRNKLTFIAEPLDDGLAEKLETGKVNLKWDKRKMGRFFQTQYDWDLLSSRSIWAFGSSPTHGTNILMDDTLPSEVDKSLLNTCKSNIVQGFQWATREGPLCEEPVRATKLKILDAVLADKPIHRGGGQIIPTARRTVHSALLTATPRLMEPIYRLQIHCPGEIVEAIQPLLTKRRGHMVSDKPIPGTPLFSVKGFLPVIDSFGFETDLRIFTQGQALVSSVFDHWAVVPGDPLDRSIILHPLEPSPPQHLAREFLVKTRRRKGLSEDVSMTKFFDEGMKSQLLQDAVDI